MEKSTLLANDNKPRFRGFLRVVKKMLTDS